MKLLTYEDAAEACHMSAWWIRKQVREGKLAVIRFGRHPRIRPEALELFVRTFEPLSDSDQLRARMQMIETKVSIGR